MAMELEQGKLGSTADESPPLWIFAPLQFPPFFSLELKFWFYTRKPVHTSGQRNV